MFFTCFFSSTLLASSVPSMFYVCWFIFLPWTMILVFYKFHSMPNGDAISQRLCCWLQLLVPSFTEFVGRPFGDWNHFFLSAQHDGVVRRTKPHAKKKRSHSIGNGKRFRRRLCLPHSRFRLMWGQLGNTATRRRTSFLIGWNRNGNVFTSFWLIGSWTRSLWTSR